MNSMIVWIETPLATAIHDRQLAEHGGTSGLRDANLLEFALARPKHVLACSQPPADIAALAASLACGLARNHPFVDGNKRTAQVCYRTFLLLNGASFVAESQAKYRHILALAEGTLDEAGFATWLRRHLDIEADDTVQEAAVDYSAR